MRWQFWQKPVPRKLPGQIKQVLMAQFGLDVASVDQLRCYTRMGSLANQRAEYIRIFDPDLIEEGESAPTNYDAFALIDPRRTALLFEGHQQKISSIGPVLLTDRRSH